MQIGTRAEKRSRESIDIVPCELWRLGAHYASIECVYYRFDSVQYTLLSLVVVPSNKTLELRIIL